MLMQRRSSCWRTDDQRPNLYFDQTGKQVKGATATNPDGSISYYDVQQGKRLLIVGLKFLQGNGYTLTLKERLRVKLRLMNEEVNHFLWLLFRKKLSNFYTFRSFVWPKSGIITC
ncbi:MAG: hypothetical protein ACLS36_00995 [Streptococcus sp.]